MLLVNQSKTAGFRPISKYKYIVPRQPRCQLILQHASDNAQFMWCMIVNRFPIPDLQDYVQFFV